MAFLAAAVVSVVLERTLYRRLYRASELDQVLLTIGLAFMSIASAAYIFGTVLQPARDAVLPARLDHVISASISASIACSSSPSASPSRCCWC